MSAVICKLILWWCVSYYVVVCPICGMAEYFRDNM